MSVKLLKKIKNFSEKRKESLAQTQIYTSEIEQEKIQAQKHRYHRPHHGVNFDGTPMQNLSRPSSEQEIIQSMRLIFENASTISSARKEVALHRMFTYMQDTDVPITLKARLKYNITEKYAHYSEQKKTLTVLRNTFKAEQNNIINVSDVPETTDVPEVDDSKSNFNTPSKINFKRQPTSWGRIDSEGNKLPTTRQAYKSHMRHQFEPQKLATLQTDKFNALIDMIRANPTRAMNFLTAKEGNARDKSAGAYLTRFDPELMYCVHDLMYTPENMHHAPEFMVDTTNKEPVYIDFNMAHHTNFILKQQNATNILHATTKNCIDLHAKQFKYEFMYQHSVNFAKNTLKVPTTLILAATPFVIRYAASQIAYTVPILAVDSAKITKEFALSVNYSAKNFVAEHSLQASLKLAKRFGKTRAERQQASVKLENFTSSKKDIREEQLKAKAEQQPQKNETFTQTTDAKNEEKKETNSISENSLDTKESIEKKRWRESIGTVRLKIKLIKEDQKNFEITTASEADTDIDIDIDANNDDSLRKKASSLAIAGLQTIVSTPKALFSGREKTAKPVIKQDTAKMAEEIREEKRQQQMRKFAEILQDSSIQHIHTSISEDAAMENFGLIPDLYTQTTMDNKIIATTTPLKQLNTEQNTKPINPETQFKPSLNFNTEKVDTDVNAEKISQTLQKKEDEIPKSKKTKKERRKLVMA
jgi:hypothetical protein